MPTNSIVAAPASGCGKSSVTLGLLGALRLRGLEVAPFKVGPDFIDPGHHAAVCGRPGRNLDGWMCDRNSVLDSFARGLAGADLGLVEGVMGLFDGASGASDAGSSAEIARWLQAKILLVIDVRAQARSAAAIAWGLTTFAPDLSFAEVLYNRVGSSAHERLLREAHASVPDLPALLGCLPRRDDLTLPERHLGLVTAADADAAPIYARLADWVETHADIDQLLATLVRQGNAKVLSPRPQEEPPGLRGHGKPVRIGVARDAAFCFCYADNLELLERAGAQLLFFSPLAEQLPIDLDGLYLPGGYPELHGERLAANRELLDAIRRAAATGLPIYAECGGLLYLAEGILPAEPTAVAPPCELVGLFPGRARMLTRRKAIGYREVTLLADTPLGPAGTVARGHEFHYSELELPADLTRAYSMADRTGSPCGTDGFVSGNVLGAYVHLHFASNPQLAENFVTFCRNRRQAGP